MGGISSGPRVVPRGLGIDGTEKVCQQSLDDAERHGVAQKMHGMR